MNRLEDRLHSELSKASEDDHGQDFVDVLTRRLQHRRRGRVLLLTIATLVAAALVTGLMLEVAALLPI